MLPQLVMIATLIFILATGFILTARKPFDAMFFFLGLVIYRHFPALLYPFHLHGQGHYIKEALAGDALLLMALVFSLFMLSLYGGYVLMKRAAPGQSIFPAYLYSKSHNLVLLGIIVLTLGGFFVAYIPLKQSGGDVFKAIYLVRQMEFYEGISFLKKFVQFGTLLSGLAMVDLLVRRKRGEGYSLARLLVLSGLLAINLGYGFIMGGKGYIIFPLAFMAITYAVCACKRPLRALMVPIMLLVLLILSLQFIRLTLVKEGHVKDPLDAAYGALHFDVMDSNVVFLDTLGTLHSEETGESFINGALGVVPRFLWAGKPAQINAGGAFKQALNPGSSGAWPVFAYNQWFSSFGWGGLIVGGFLSGWVLALIQARYGQHRKDTYSIFISLVMVFYFVTPTGLQNEVFMNYIFVVLPLFLFKFCTQGQWSLLSRPVREG